MKYVIDGQTLTDIADAIREGYDEPFKMTPELMPYDIRTIIDERNTNLDNIKTAIENNGVEVPDDTLTSEYADKIDEVAEVAHNDGMYEFEKAITANWTRTNYLRAFVGTDFSGITFSKTIEPSIIGRMFYNYVGATLPINIDCSGSVATGEGESVGAYATFSWMTNVEEVPDYGIPAQHTYYQTYHTSRKLKKIAVIRSKASTVYNGTFTQCSVLEDVTFDGKIGRNISFSNSPNLTVASLKNIITHLVDYTGTSNEYTYKLTLHADSKALLEAEGNTSPNGNSWLEYIDDLKWNV